MQGFLTGHERKQKAKLQFLHVPFPNGIKTFIIIVITIYCTCSEKKDGNVL